MYKFTNTWKYQTNIYVSDVYKYVTAVTKNALKSILYISVPKYGFFITWMTIEYQCSVENQTFTHVSRVLLLYIIVLQLWHIFRYVKQAFLIYSNISSYKQAALRCFFFFCFVQLRSISHTVHVYGHASITTARNRYFNSLRPSDALWWHWSWTTLPHAMACLTLFNATAHSDAAVTVLFRFARNSISIRVRGWYFHQTWPETARERRPFL